VHQFPSGMYHRPLNSFSSDIPVLLRGCPLAITSCDDRALPNPFNGIRHIPLRYPKLFGAPDVTIHLTYAYTYVRLGTNKIDHNLSHGKTMETVNALRLRNNLGAVLDQLTETGEPILVSKGRQIRAVLITPEQYEKRFIDWQVEKEKVKFLENINRLKQKRVGEIDSIEVLRQVRGYGK
jgi:PHD/YefM family antitoxin component YafN of YafNO toxin-antitoxin module